MINKCVVCGTEFEAIKSTKKYCSDKCMKIARNQRNREKTKEGIKGNRSKVCPLCGKTFAPKTASASNRICCYDCMPDGTQLTRGMFLAKIKQIRGGKCVRCGYDKCLKALEFHHLDPSQKDFTISNDHFKLLDAIEESKKCILLCSNCHKEFHDDLWSLSELNLGEEEVESWN